MCVIAYKPVNMAFPEENILRNCFENNPDGAGFMYTFKQKVYIRKGYTTFESFKSALDRARNITGDKVPYVMHFRIATQGYEKTMTHPFPLSSKMSNLKKTKTECSIGVAHNGIISLTSDGSKDYSDTMKFITDYLSLIIRNFSWYKDDRVIKLIENLIGASRLAVLDKKNHCTLIGRGWVEDKGIYYSNNSYSYKKVVLPTPAYSGRHNYFWDDDGYDVVMKNTQKSSKETEKCSWALPQFKSDNKVAEYGSKYNEYTNEYDFDEKDCPVAQEYDDTYCYACRNYGKCAYCKKAAGFDIDF